LLALVTLLIHGGIMKRILISLSLIATTAFANNIDSIRLESKTLNNYTPALHNQIITNIKKDKPLHGRQLRLMHEMVFHYIRLDKELIKLSKSTKSISEELLLNLDRYQSFLVNYEPYYSTKKFRRYINDEDLTFDLKRHELNLFIMPLLESSYVSTINSKLKKVLSSSSSDANTIKISNHKALKFVQNVSKIKALNSNYIKYYKSDLQNDRIVDATDRLSGGFGNTAGGVRWRKGHLLKKINVHQEIKNQLKPLDIITEKTYFALTDKLIPGHFGHNAIWLGTKEDLVQNGMWNHKAIIPFQKQIEAGKSILEVDRSGTHLKSLKVFMNVDEFAILRLKEIHGLSNERVEEIYTVALSQVGKIYDFNFDVETTDKLVCSELLYQSFTNVFWPTKPYVGRVTITPDNVTSLALYDNPPIDLVYYVAQKKKREGHKYKDLDQLASDLDYAKIGGVYKKKVKKCKSDDLDKTSCEIEYQDLIYTGHSTIDGINF
jgi:uncharacterized protein YycO